MWVVSIVFLSFVLSIEGNMEGFIVGGEFAKISNFPHSAFLSVSCMTRKKEIVPWICGASVVNQKILLTAGHCVYNCFEGTYIVINAGNEYRNRGMLRTSHGFILHENYNSKTSANDIALIKVFKPLQFNNRISRVAIMKNPPYSEPAYLAGWGLTCEHEKKLDLRLKHINQKIWKRNDCMDLLGYIPPGTVCASSSIKNEFAAQGDSGSALIARGFIQLGLVSYKVPTVAANLIIYTDTGYFHDWIVANTKRLFCFEE